MGLKYHQSYGVKSMLRHRYGKVFRECETLAAAGRLAGKNRESSLSALDGNVMVMQVPDAVRPLEGYVSVLCNSVFAAMAASKIVFVVFDEPEVLTLAKREEQARRDMQRNRREVNVAHDLDPHPTTDEYTLADLQAVCDCHRVMACRPARLRFIDELMRQVLQRCEQKMKSWEAQGFVRGAVLVDGVDPRGADRPVDHVREPTLVGTDSRLVELFGHADLPIGEGDMKLAHVARRIRELVAADAVELQGCEMHLTVTIDTDSIAIELLEAAKRQEKPLDGKRMSGMLCMRERGSKRARDGGEGGGGSHYLCCDTEHLHELLQQSMWKPAKQAPTPFGRRLAITFLVAGWALAGCDFVELKGLRADVVLDSLPALMTKHPEVLARMSAAWGHDREAAVEMTRALAHLLNRCSGWMHGLRGIKMDAVQRVAQAEQEEPDVLLRAAWTVCYWSGTEWRGPLDDFGFTAGLAALV